jgi:hypothetical protein
VRFAEYTLDPGLKLVECASEHLWKFGGVKNGKMLDSHVSLLLRFVWLGRRFC